MEIVICTINNDEYLNDTLNEFKKNINIDPFPNNENIDKIINIAKNYCDNIEYRIGTNYSAAAGLLWGC